MDDGRCMYRAVAKGANEGAPLDQQQATKEADRLRKIGVDAMGGAARILLAGTQNMDANETIEDRQRRMRRPDEYAESAEVVALSVAMGRPVTVLLHRDSHHVVDYNKVYTREELAEHLRVDPDPDPDPDADPRDPAAKRIFIFHDGHLHYSALRRVTRRVRVRDSCPRAFYSFVRCMCRVRRRSAIRWGCASS